MPPALQQVPLVCHLAAARSLLPSGQFPSYHLLPPRSVTFILVPSQVSSPLPPTASASSPLSRPQSSCPFFISFLIFSASINCLCMISMEVNGLQHPPRPIDLLLPGTRQSWDQALLAALSSLPCSLQNKDPAAEGRRVGLHKTQQNSGERNRCLRSSIIFH